MKEQKITIIIDKNGKIIADAENFSGPICLAELQKLFKGLPEIEEEEKKPEFYSPDSKVSHKTLDEIRRI